MVFDTDDCTNLAVQKTSTIVQPVFQEGATAEALLIDYIRGKIENPPTTTIECETI